MGQSNRAAEGTAGATTTQAGNQQLQPNSSTGNTNTSPLPNTLAHTNMNPGSNNTENAQMMNGGQPMTNYQNNSQPPTIGYTQQFQNQNFPADQSKTPVVVDQTQGPA